MPRFDYDAHWTLDREMGLVPWPIDDYEDEEYDEYEDDRRYGCTENECAACDRVCATVKIGEVWYCSLCAKALRDQANDRH